MHTTSLIGQALGGATGSKTSPAQDAPKKTQDRSFADHVNDAASKQEAVKSQTSETIDSGEADQAAADVDGAPAKSEDAATDKVGNSESESYRDGEQTPSEEAIVAGNVAVDTGKRSPKDPDLLEGARVGQSPRAVPEQAGTEAAKSAEQVTAKEGEATIPKAGVNVEHPSAGQKDKQTIETQAPARVAQLDGKADTGAARGGEAKVGDQSAMTKAIGSAEEAGKRSAGTQAGFVEQAAARVSQEKSGAVVPSANQAEAKASLKAEEKAADARMAAADKATPAAAAAASKTSSADSLPKSVFQMQVENAEAGDSRKARYRTRNGDAQIAAEVAKASTAAAGVQTNAATAVNATTNSAIAMMQALQADTMKLSQAPGLLGDSSGSGLSMTADLPGLPQLLTEAVFQPGITHRPETPRMIASQMAEAFVAKGDRNVDVSLNPEELGKVKMRVATSENGITMIIQTERPETGDLMRRHINELAEEFRRMGFQDISFEFSSGDSAGGQAQQGLGDGTGAGTGHGASTGATDMSATDEVAETQIQNLRLGSTGVDMRV
ncbi:flagellar hook-length control protein FliK [Phaeobacter gallaeciensis]|uniref:flagellar hook-length control protein FliK n=1 Tax=Phaeobacter gallaeciensis TaxID=60890 RepID=UPI0023800117|nr:flagellar hook-length control protein FliK [Phaeobacter gallaeciensis]MDE4274772.1 flagellar hook-length control protein FliK [Phaeobacter gallaeciensis]MDE4300311.1 flagellar hook-length control protein FliK [Phaeobacter gallaeciensis]MDE5185475.1 flagellar hook-length control protein FliK [Phaeobacter gallaeciensis]